MLTCAGHRRRPRAGQSQRARDHALPRRPGPGERGPSRRRGGRARPGVGSARPTAIARGGSASGWRTCSTPPCSASGSNACCPTRTCCSSSMDGEPVRGRCAGRGGPRLGRAAARPPGRHDLARPGRTGARRARPARRCPGHAARPRPRQLSVRDVVEPGRRRRLHGRRHRPAPGRRGHRRHEGLLDACRVRARIRPSSSTASAQGIAERGNEYGTVDRPSAPGRLVRCRPAALRRRRQQRQLDHAQQARHPVGHRPTCGSASPTRSTAAASTRGRRAAPLSRARRRSTTSSRAGPSRSTACAR